MRLNFEFELDSGYHRFIGTFNDDDGCDGQFYAMQEDGETYLPCAITQEMIDVVEHEHDARWAQSDLEGRIEAERRRIEACRERENELYREMMS